jgi:hypothetical protein
MSDNLVLIQTRLAICKKCESNNGTNGCTACGCLISEKTKQEKSTCPIGKW